MADLGLRCSFIVLLGILIAGVLAAAGDCFGGESTADARTLLESVCSNWGTLRAQVVLDMETRRADGSASESRILVRRDGSSRMRVDYQSPERDRGKAMLLLGDKAWLYLPRADIAVSVSSRRNPLAGGILFDDLLKDCAADYSLALDTTGSAYVIELRPREDAGGQWSRLHLCPRTLLPIKREIYSRTGKLLRKIIIDEIRSWKGRSVPSRLRFIEMRRGGRNVTVKLTLVSIGELPEQELPLLELDAFKTRHADGDGR